MSIEAGPGAAARIADAGAKAHILAEALPYIREFSGQIGRAHV